MTNENVTPMMVQYLGIKAGHADALLFYRMGDFYELFFDDAVQAAAALDIALTHRGKHQGRDIPMCGVPHHAAEGYLLTLIRKGFRVAVCEQMESPAAAKKRGSKSVVKRDVVRLVTPGTLTEDSLLDGRRHNHLAAFAEIRGDGAFAWTDLSTGDVTVTTCPRVALPVMLARTRPSEVLVLDDISEELRATIEESGAVLTPLSANSFDSQSAERRIVEHYKIRALDAFGSLSRPEIAGLGAVIDYLALTQTGRVPLLRRPQQEKSGGSMEIDAATRRNLELAEALSGGRDGSLLATMDRTVTAAGARLLETRLASPSTDLSVVAGRHDAVAHFCENQPVRRELRAIFRAVPDMERSLSRLALGRGGPRDLSALRDGLTAAADIAGILNEADLPAGLALCLGQLEGFEDVAAELSDALVADPPTLARDGGFIAPGYTPALDAARTLRDEGRSVMAALQGEYQALTGVTALKIKHNAVLGYFVETPATHTAKMTAPPLSEHFIHRQTTANQIRFTTARLSELQSSILSAGSDALEIEQTLFQDLSQAVHNSAAEIAQAARSLAELDVSAALADLAADAGWVRPSMTSDRAFRIEAGRHPVVEAALRRDGKSFVGNDCDLSEDSGRPAWLVTGPNMAGKSTFLRQNALLAILAQMGSFVPARQATIGIVDQVFSRVGAADDLARGRSTFMVEMVETAAILNQARDRALVILDEIGRGTATYDGLSIAWATLEHLLVTNRCRTLFATHYHELTALAADQPRLRNATVAVREWEGSIIFLHELREGIADRSYGVQVARLAGLPDAVIDRARAILDVLEADQKAASNTSGSSLRDLPLFNQTPPAPPAPQAGSPVLERIEQVDPDTLSPREALDILYEIKRLAEQD